MCLCGTTGQGGVLHHLGGVLCGTTGQGGVLHHLGGVLTSLNRYCTIWDIAAIVLQISRVMGPVSPLTSRNWLESLTF